MILSRTASLTLLCGLVAAQAPTIQVSAISPITANAIYPTSHPSGPLPGGFNVSSVGPAASASIVLSQTSASAYASGYQFSTAASASYTFSTAGFAHCSGTFEFLLTRPSPTPVQVTLGGSKSGLGSCQTLVDINADGSNEVVISNFGVSGAGNYNLMVGPKGTRIRVSHSSGASPSFYGRQYVSVNSSLQMTFTSGLASLDSYGAGCFDLGGDLTQAGSLQLECPASAGSLVVLALGTTPLSVPLPFTPGCLLLLQPLVTTTALPSAGVASFSFVGAAPPPGVSLQLQAARLDPAGVITTSNGLTLTGL